MNRPRHDSFCWQVCLTWIGLSAGRCVSPGLVSVCCAGRCVSPGLVVQVHLLVAPPRTRLVPYVRLGLGDVLVQLLSFLSRLVTVREYTLSGQSL